MGWGLRSSAISTKRRTIQPMNQKYSIVDQSLTPESTVKMARHEVIRLYPPQGHFRFGSALIDKYNLRERMKLVVAVNQEQRSILLLQITEEQAANRSTGVVTLRRTGGKTAGGRPKVHFSSRTLFEQLKIAREPTCVSVSTTQAEDGKLTMTLTYPTEDD